MILINSLPSALPSRVIIFYILMFNNLICSDIKPVERSKKYYKIYKLKLEMLFKILKAISYIVAWKLIKYLKLHPTAFCLATVTNPSGLI